MMDEIRAKRDEIYAIARCHKAEKLWVFGLCAHGFVCPWGGREPYFDYTVKRDMVCI